MILRGNRTVFREDLGIWLRREVWLKESNRWQPKCMGWNHSGYRWTGWRRLVRRERRHIIQWLWIKPHPRSTNNENRP